MSCRSLCGFSPSLSDQLTAKLKEINGIFPQTNFMVLLNSEGEVVAQGESSSSSSSSSSAASGSGSGSSVYSGKLPEEFLAPIAALKKTCLQFSSALSQSECPVLHIRGNTHLFSLYEIDSASAGHSRSFLLAFYSEMSGIQLEGLPLLEADQKMEPILDQLKLLLQNLQ
jgi:hypothetical protein